MPEVSKEQKGIFLNVLLQNDASVIQLQRIDADLVNLSAVSCGKSCSYGRLDTDEIRELHKTQNRPLFVQNQCIHEVFVCACVLTCEMT